MEGYSVTEAASVLGVPTERVWELLARGILSGTPEGETGMRVFLQPRPAPRAAIEEPRAGNGDATPRPPEVESSPFRELLTEFRNLTERYGQALLALGEARGEVASLRSRVDLLEARFDLRLPMSGPVPQPGAPRGSRTVAEPAAEDVGASRSADAAEHEVEEPPRRKRGRAQRRATDEFAEALARAEDPTPAELPGAADAGAAFAALREEAELGAETAEEIEASLPRDLPAAEPIAALETEPEPIAVSEAEPEPIADSEAEPVISIEDEPIVAEARADAPEAGVEPPREDVEPPREDVEPPREAEVEPPVPAVSEPAAPIEPAMTPAADGRTAPPAPPEAVSPGEAEPAEQAVADDADTAAGTVVRFEAAAEPAPALEPAWDAVPAPSAVTGLEPEPEPMTAWDVPADATGDADDEWPVASVAEPTPATQPASEGVPGERTTDEPSWDRQRYTTAIEEPDWIPEEPAPQEWSARPSGRMLPVPDRPATSDRVESEAFGWGQDETERWFASGEDLPSHEAEPTGADDQPIPEAETQSEGTVEPAPAPIEDPAEEMEVAGASGHGLAQPTWEGDEQSIEPAAPTPWAPAPSPLPAWAERFPSPSASPSPTSSPESPGTSAVEAGPASRAYRRLRRIFPG